MSEWRLGKVLEVDAEEDMLWLEPWPDSNAPTLPSEAADAGPSSGGHATVSEAPALC